MRKILLVLIAALAALLPAGVHAASKPLPTISYTTTASVPGYLDATTATVSNVRFELNPVLPGYVCVGYDVLVHGSFEYYTGAYFTTMRQLAPQHQQECYGLVRDALRTALDCPTAGATTTTASVTTTTAGATTTTAGVTTTTAGPTTTVVGPTTTAGVTTTTMGAPTTTAGATATTAGVTAAVTAAATFELGSFIRHPRIAFTGDDGSTLFAHAQLGPYTLVATTAEQQEAICDLEARLDRYGDKKLVAELNELLALFA